MVRVQREDKVVEILKRHWPNADDVRIAHRAKVLALRAILNNAGEANSSRSKGKNNSLIELRQVNELTIKLAEKLSGLGSESSQMLTKAFQLKVEGDFDSRTVMLALSALSKASAEAHAVISDRDYTPAPAHKPKKTASRVLAKGVADIFEEFAGRPATISVRDGRAYGPYLDLLKEIFEVVGVTASAEAAGRAAIMEKRGAKPKQTPLETK